MGYGKYEGMICSVPGCSSHARVNGKCLRCYDGKFDVYKPRRQYIMKQGVI